jgi:hypothetical protein
MPQYAKINENLAQFLYRNSLMEPGVVNFLRTEIEEIDYGGEETINDFSEEAELLDVRRRAVPLPVIRLKKCPNLKFQVGFDCELL